MQIVIEIDDRAWMDEESIRKSAFEYEKGSTFDKAIREGIKNAIVLPKNHGDLKDVSKIEYLPGVFMGIEGPLPIIHKIATIEMIRDWLPTIIEGVKADE